MDIFAGYRTLGQLLSPPELEGTVPLSSEEAAAHMTTYTSFLPLVPRDFASVAAFQQFDYGEPKRGSLYIHPASQSCRYKLPPNLGGFQLFLTSHFDAPFSFLSSGAPITPISDTVPLLPEALLISFFNLCSLCSSC